MQELAMILFVLGGACLHYSLDRIPSKWEHFLIGIGLSFGLILSGMLVLQRLAGTS